MKATVLFRIVAVVFVIFAAGHTFGFLSFRAPTQEGRDVLDAMNRVHFQADGKTFSYGGWYRGFGLSATFAMLFQAFLAWHLGTMAARGASDVKTIGWAFFAWQLPGLVLSLLYYGIPPTVLSALTAALIAAAVWLSP